MSLAHAKNGQLPRQHRSLDHVSSRSLRKRLLELSKPTFFTIAVLVHITVLLALIFLIGGQPSPALVSFVTVTATLLFSNISVFLRGR